MRRESHVRFGGRAEETDRPKGRHRASARPLQQAAWSGQVDLLPGLRDPRRLFSLRARLDGRHTGERRPRRAPHRRDGREGGHRARAAHRPCRPGDIDAQQVGRPPARRPRGRAEPFPAPRVQRLYSEAQFKTLKYRPTFPARFGSLEDARSFCAAFFTWYNTQHRHAGIGLLTPADVHAGRAAEITASRVVTLDAAYLAHPERFVRRPPTPPEVPTAVWINPPATREVPPQ